MIPSVPREHIGQAREFRRRVAAEERELRLVLDMAMLPVKARLRRYPERALRPEMLIELARHWRAAPATFRLSYEANRDGTMCVITERRLSAGSMERLDDVAWRGTETVIAIVALDFLVWREKAKLRERPLALFSLHSIARRLQRDPHCDEALLISDIALVAKVDAASVPQNEGFIIHTTEGGWRGRVVRNKRTDGEVERLIAVRTWLPAEALADAA